MNQYLAETTISLAAGTVRVTLPQLRRRRFQLQPLTEDEMPDDWRQQLDERRLEVEADDDGGTMECRILQPIQFKAGEEFGYESPDGRMPKTLIDGMSLLDGGGVDDEEKPARSEVIRSVIASMDPTDESLWTTSGPPDLRELNQRMPQDFIASGGKVSGDERDSVWAEMQG